jgi:hypothetical protein
MGTSNFGMVIANCWSLYMSLLLKLIVSISLFPFSNTVSFAQNLDSDVGVSKFCSLKEFDWGNSITSSTSLPDGSNIEIEASWPRMELRPRLLAQESELFSSLSLALAALSKAGHLKSLKKLSLVMTLSDEGGFGAAFCTNLQKGPSHALLLVNRRTLTHPEQLIRLVAHEMSHWVMEQNDKRDYPRWYEETLGTVEEYRALLVPTGPWFLAVFRLPQMGLTSLDSNEVLTDHEQKLSAYGHLALFSIYLEKLANHSLLSFSLGEKSNDPFEILEEFVDKYLGDYFSDLEEAFTGFVVAKHVNRLNDYADKKEQELTYLYSISEEVKAFTKAPALQPWSGISVPVDVTLSSSKLEKDYWVETSLIRKIEWSRVESGVKCPYEECLRLRVRHK